MSSTTQVRIEQEELETIKKSVLTSSRGFLVDSIDPANHLSYLRSKFIFDEREAEEICAQPSRSARAEVFLDKLARKGSLGYDEFQNSLCRDKTQLFLLTHMTKKLELLKHRVREFKEQQMKQHQEQVKLQRQYRPQQQKMNFAHVHTFQQKAHHPTTNAAQPPHQRPVNHLPQHQRTTYPHHNTTHQPIPMSSNSTILQQQPRVSHSPQSTVLQQHHRMNHYQPQVTQYQRVQQQVPNFCQPQQQSTGSFRTVPSPQAPSHPHNHHRHHQPHPHQNPPNFHSRGPDSNTNGISDENSLQDSLSLDSLPYGQPCGTLPLDSSLPCGQPCGNLPLDSSLPCGQPS